MNYLLDTHAWLWFVTGDPKLPPSVRDKLDADDAVRWVSPITAWELAMLAERGRLALPSAVTDYLAAKLSDGVFREAPLTWAIATESRRVRLPHGDPADRFLAATARVNGLTLVTADANLRSLKEIDVLGFSARKR